MSGSPSVVRNSAPQSGRHDELGTHVARVALDPRERAFADRHHPIAPSLALADEHRAAFVVHVGQPQRHELAPTDARRVQELEDRAITLAHRRADVRLGKHAFDLVGGEHVARAADAGGAAGRARLRGSRAGRSDAPAT